MSDADWPRPENFSKAVKMLEANGFKYADADEDTWGAYCTRLAVSLGNKIEKHGMARVHYSIVPGADQEEVAREILAMDWAVARGYWTNAYLIDGFSSWRDIPDLLRQWRDDTRVFFRKMRDRLRGIRNPYEAP